MTWLNVWLRRARRALRGSPPPPPRWEVSVVDERWARLDIVHDDGRRFAYLVRRATPGQGRRPTGPRT